jgi:hypothetical protein
MTMPRPWSNERVDVLLADLKGQRVGDVYQKPVGTQGKTLATVLVNWQGCECEPRSVDCNSLNKGHTKGCGGCLHKSGGTRDVAFRAASLSAKLRQAEATLARANEMDVHDGYVAWLLDPRPYGTKGKTKRWMGYRCPEGHEGEMMLSNWTKGKGCPSCAEHGYKPDKPGSFYVVAGRGWLKCGISNTHSLDTRLDKHRKQGLTEVLHLVHFADGVTAQGLEALWLEQLERIPAEHRPSKDDISDGYTEAAPDIHMIRRWIDALIDAVATAA